MDRNDPQKYFAGWYGYVARPQKGDYHVDGERRLPLHELGELVAERQARKNVKVA